MVGYCCVPLCKTYGKKGSNIKFHFFPKDKSLRKTWVILVRINKEPTKNSKVCSRHFEESDYIITSMGQFKILKKGAVPTLNLPVRSHEKTIKQRRIKTVNPVANAPDISSLPTKIVKQSLKTNYGIKHPLFFLHRAPTESLPAHTTQFQPYTSTTTTSTRVSFAGNSQVLKNTIRSPNVPCQPIKKFLLSNIQTDPLAPKPMFKPKIGKNDITTQTDKQFFCEHAVQTDSEPIPTETMRYDELSDDDIKFFTGFNMLNFQELTKYLDIDSKSNKYANNLSNYDQLILTLIKLRHNFEFKILAKMYGIHQGMVREIFVLWINLMFDQFRKSDLWSLQEKRNSRYTAIVHCCEIPCQTNNSVSRDILKSEKMKRLTIKYLVATNEEGLLIFCSNKLFGGSTSDRQVIVQSGILAKLKNGDKVLSELDFGIEDLLVPNGITFQQPHECSDKNKGQEYLKFVAVMTKKFKILKGIFPARLMPYATSIVYVTNVLVNYVNEGK